MQLEISEETNKQLENKYDFYRRLNGRLSVQYRRLAQMEKVLVETSKKNKNKIRRMKERIRAVNYTISEMEFIKSNFLDDFQEGVFSL